MMIRNIFCFVLAIMFLNGVANNFLTHKVEDAPEPDNLDQPFKNGLHPIHKYQMPDLLQEVLQKNQNDHDDYNEEEQAVLKEEPEGLEMKDPVAFNSHSNSQENVTMPRIVKRVLYEPMQQESNPICFQKHIENKIALLKMAAATILLLIVLIPGSYLLYIYISIEIVNSRTSRSSRERRQQSEPEVDLVIETEPIPQQQSGPEVSLVIETEPIDFIDGDESSLKNETNEEADGGKNDHLDEAKESEV